MQQSNQWPQVIEDTYTFIPSNEVLTQEQKETLREIVQDIDIFVGFGTQLLSMIALSNKEEVSAVSFDITPGLLLQMLLVAYYDTYRDDSFFIPKRMEQTNLEEDHQILTQFAVDFFNDYLQNQPILLDQIMFNLDQLLVKLVRITTMWYRAYSKTSYYDYIIDPAKRMKLMNAINNKRITFLPTDLREDYGLIEEYFHHIGTDSQICFYGSNTLEYIKTYLGNESPQDWLNRIWAENDNVRVAIVTSFGEDIFTVRLEEPDISFGVSSFLLQAKRK